MRKRKITRKKEKQNSSTKADYSGIRAIIALASSLAKEARGPSAAGINMVCTNRKSRENECNHCKTKSIGRVGTLMQPICNEHRLRKKLL